MGPHFSVRQSVLRGFGAHAGRVGRSVGLRMRQRFDAAWRLFLDSSGEGDDVLAVRHCARTGELRVSFELVHGGRIGLEKRAVKCRRGGRVRQHRLVVVRVLHSRFEALRARYALREARFEVAKRVARAVSRGGDYKVLPRVLVLPKLHI